MRAPFFLGRFEFASGGRLEPLVDSPKQWKQNPRWLYAHGDGLLFLLLQSSPAAIMSFFSSTAFPPRFLEKKVKKKWKLLVALCVCVCVCPAATGRDNLARIQQPWTTGNPKELHPTVWKRNKWRPCLVFSQLFLSHFAPVSFWFFLGVF